MKRDRVKTAVVVDLTSSSVEVKYDVDRSSTVKELFELFSAHPRREYAAALLQRLNNMDPDQRKGELNDGEATQIVESAAYLVVATDPEDAIVGLALILLIQSCGFAPQYIEMSMASFTALCVLTTQQFVQSPHFAPILQSILACAKLANIRTVIFRDALTWWQCLYGVHCDDYDWGVVNKVIADFSCEICLLSDDRVRSAQGMLACWWELPLFPRSVMERIVFAILTLISRARDPREAVAISKHFGENILDGFAVHKLLPKKVLLNFCYAVGQIVQSSEWPAGEVFLTHFIRLIVMRMSSRLSKKTTTEEDNEFVEMGFAMFYEWRDLIQKLRVSLDHAPRGRSCEVRDRLREILFLRTASRSADKDEPPKVTPSAAKKARREAEEWIDVLDRCEAATYFYYMRELAHECADSTSESWLAHTAINMYAFESEYDTQWHVKNPISPITEDIVLTGIIDSLKAHTQDDIYRVCTFYARFYSPIFTERKFRYIDIIKNRICGVSNSSPTSLESCWKYLLVFIGDDNELVLRKISLVILDCLCIESNREIVRRLVKEETGFHICFTMLAERLDYRVCQLLEYCEVLSKNPLQPSSVPWLEMIATRTEGREISRVLRLIIESAHEGLLAELKAHRSKESEMPTLLQLLSRGVAEA